MAVPVREACSDTERRQQERNAGSGGHEGRMQTERACDVGAARGQAPADKPALKPYRGKPAVRNFRGDDGNVGIIRSPVRAIALPDRVPMSLRLTQGDENHGVRWFSTVPKPD